VVNRKPTVWYDAVCLAVGNSSESQKSDNTKIYFLGLLISMQNVH